MNNNTSQIQSKEALSWVEELVSKTGTRLTGSIGCKKAAKIIFFILPLFLLSIYKKSI